MTTISVDLDDNLELSANVVYGSGEPVDHNVSWKVSNSSIMCIKNPVNKLENNKVYLMQRGTCTVTATSLIDSSKRQDKIFKVGTMNQKVRFVQLNQIELQTNRNSPDNEERRLKYFRPLSQSLSYLDDGSYININMCQLASQSNVYYDNEYSDSYASYNIKLTYYINTKISWKQANFKFTFISGTKKFERTFTLTSTNSTVYWETPNGNCPELLNVLLEAEISQEFLIEVQLLDFI